MAILRAERLQGAHTYRLRARRTPDLTPPLQYLTYTEFYDTVGDVSSGMSALGLDHTTRFNIYASTS